MVRSCCDCEKCGSNDYSLCMQMFFIVTEVNFSSVFWGIASRKYTSSIYMCSCMDAYILYILVCKMLCVCVFKHHSQTLDKKGQNLACGVQVTRPALITACGCGNGSGFVITTPTEVVLAAKIYLKDQSGQNLACGLQVPG